MVEPTQPPAPTDSGQSKAPDFDIDALTRDIEAANKKLVSDEMTKLIAAEKEKARQEAEKEFLTNQKLKEKEQEITALKEAQLARERAAAEQLEALKRKVDELAASKQPIQLQNPFAAKGTATSSQPNPSAGNPLENYTEQELEEVEKASFLAMLDRKSVKE